MQNIEVAWIFVELADLLELKGEDFFKIRAYRRAARAIANLDTPLEELKQRGLVGKIPGIGKAIEAKIKEIIETGKLSKHQELLREIPPGVLEIKKLPGIGPNRARILHRELGVTGLDELAQAAKERRVRVLKGFSAKMEWEILNGIGMMRNRHDRVLLSVARELAEELTEFIKILPGVRQVAVAGSTRRWKETVGDLDLVIAAEEAEALLNALATHPRVKEIIDRQEKRLRVYTWWGLAVDFQVVPPGEFLYCLHRSTGSKGHYQRLQEIAEEQGLQLNHHGMGKQGEAPILLNTEEEIYSSLGMNYVAPELRENQREVEAALKGDLPQLIQVGDIRGDLHIHTTWSDSAMDLQEVVKRCREKGYSYAAITDHSQSLKIANGLDCHRLEQQHRMIEEMNREFDDFTLLTGVEMDILPNGDLDYPDEILEPMDVVIASVHTGFKQNRRDMTRRICRAMENEHVDMIAHMTGRLLGRRGPYELDVEALLEMAAKTATVLEINASPDRLDLSDRHAKAAKEAGAKLCINTDAHDLRRLDEMVYGVAQARRAWLTPEDVINTLEIEKLREVLR
ncbi:DNA polymerase/3'-5' exonuclease PolX [Desulforamulus ruminis]|uniref:DNA-directed DNA polymerase n=1 Tax=Desulforamulus ruminis (strain ATCC 23193 / DSM 2154 / NCIMB 8452 / DL) TaxID=696281 RepID=F6DNX8_DESRL|nr:DNA polymerase/3'-5' exonuclease PolX [Desulforamulus ruminis]AEG60697.1 PHP domain protein [Desulforamulus ruminis DSM 2154]